MPLIPIAFWNRASGIWVHLSKDKAEINILYKKSAKPAVLILYMEGNIWKVGLEETFGPRNLLSY